MAKVRLDLEANLDPLRQAGLHLQSINGEALQLGQSMNSAFRTSTASIDKFDKEVQKTTRDIDKLEKQATGGFGRASTAIKDTHKQSETLGSSLKTMATGFVAGTVITGALSKVGQAFTNAIQLQKEFEKSLQNLSAITGASGADLEFYKQKALEMGVGVKGGAAAAVEAFKLIGGAKPELLANKEALVEVTDAAILLSKASGLELPEAATRLTDAMNQFGAASDQAGKFVDTLAAGAKFGAAEVPQITDALLKFGVAAKSSNISIDESVAAIELLGEKGLKGAEAGTALRNVFAKLSATKILPKEAKKELEDAGINLQKLSDTTIPIQERLKELSKIQNNANALTRVFGLENKNAAQSILQNLPRLKELTDQIGKQGLGSALEQATINTDTLDQALLEAGNAYDNMILSVTSGDFGDLIKGFVKTAGEELNKLSQQVSDVGTLFTKGFGALQDKGIDREFDRIAKGLTVEQRKATAEQLASQIKLINIQLQNNKNLSDDQKEKYNEQIINKAKLVNAILALDKKSVASTTEVIAEGAEANISETTVEVNKRLKLQEEYAKAVLDLQGRVNKANLEAASPQEKIELERKFAQEEINLFQDQFKKIALLNNSNFEFSLEQLQQFETLRKAINIKAANEQIKIEVDRQNKLAQARLSSTRSNAENLGLSEANDISSVSLSNKPENVSEADFELIKQQKILEIQRDYALKKLELKKQELTDQRNLNVAALNGELALLQGKNDAESELKRKQINESLGLIEEKFDLEGTKIQDETAIQLNDISAKIDETKKKLDGGPKFDLASLLGLSPEQLKAISAGFNQILNSLGQLLDSQIKVNDKQIESSQKRQEETDKEISDLESKLGEEKSLRDQGLANNSDRIKKEIEAKLAIQEIEKRKEKELLEEKKKLQKEKLLLDSILQLSNMATAASSLFATLAPTGPIGVGIAIGTIALMLGTFIKAKSDALKAINEGNNFAEGVVGLKGPGTETSDSIPANLSRGESVIKARVTKKHTPLLEALNSEKHGLIQQALIDELKGTGIVLDRNLPKELSNKKDAIRDNEAKIYFKQDYSKMESKLARVTEQLDEMIEKQKNSTYKDQNDNLVLKSGSHKTIIKKRG